MSSSGGGDKPSTSSSSSERLPSFKGPRDLTLASKVGGGPSSSTSSITGGSVAPGRSSKRVFKPNIPPRRGEQPLTTSSTTRPGGESLGPPRDERAGGGDNSFSRGGRGGRGGPGGRGRGAGRGRKEFIQSESVFAEGVGDPNAKGKKAAIPSMRRTGTGIGRPGGGGGGGLRSSSTVTKDTLDNLIKTEPVDRGTVVETMLPSEEASALFGDDSDYQQDMKGVEEPELQEQEDANVPLILPLASYVPEKYGPPRMIKKPVAPAKPPPPPPVVVGSVRIKTEKPDDTPAPKPPEPVLPDLPPVEPMSFPMFFAEAPKEGSIFVMQLPEKLPVLKQPPPDDKSNILHHGAGSSSSKSTSGHHPKNKPPDLATDISSLPEGYIGKIQITAGGKTFFVMGENRFELEAGVPVGFRQELVAIDAHNQTLTNLGPVSNKFVCVPDLEALFDETL